MKRTTVYRMFSWHAARNGLLFATLFVTLGYGCRPTDTSSKHNGKTLQSQNEGGVSVVRANPNLSSLEFRNQDGRIVRLADLRGKPVLMSFIYTRCTMPTMCPMTTKQVARVQQALTPDERMRIALVSVSFDPDYDTPAVMTHYAKAYGADFSNWQFWTGSKQNIFDLTNAFNMWYQEENREYAHRLISVILKPDGSYHTTLRGSDWDVPEAVKTLRSLIPAKS